MPKIMFLKNDKIKVASGDFFQVTFFGAQESILLRVLL